MTVVHATLALTSRYILQFRLFGLGVAYILCCGWFSALEIGLSAFLKFIFECFNSAPPPPPRLQPFHPEYRLRTLLQGKAIRHFHYVLFFERKQVVFS